MLLWVSPRVPQEPSDEVEPIHVTQDMLAQVGALVTEVVIVVDDTDPADDPVEGKVFAETDHAAACETMGPEVHTKVADSMQPVLEKMLS